MIINLLCDNKNSWFWNTCSDFIKNIEQESHEVNVCKSEDALVKADISAFISCTKLVSSNGLKKSKSNIVCHPSDLPLGRGFSPIAWEILNNKEELTFTLFEAVEGADEGDIYLKNKVKLNGTELNDELRTIQSSITYDMILKYIQEYPNNKSIPQVGESSWYKKRSPMDSEININKTVLEQINLFRIVDNENYPAFFYYKGQKFILTIDKEV